MKANTCLYCGREIEENPYLGDTNPDHVLEIADAKAPSMDILHAEGREYDTFCSKEHYVKWVEGARKRLERRTSEGQDKGHTGYDASL